MGVDGFKEGICIMMVPHDTAGEFAHIYVSTVPHRVLCGAFRSCRNYDKTGDHDRMMEWAATYRDIGTLRWVELQR
jgi:hypothetical protein